MARLPLLIAGLGSGSAAHACPVCGTALEASKRAFIFSTAFLSLVPLLMIGGLILFLYLRVRDAGHRGN